MNVRDLIPTLVIGGIAAVAAVWAVYTAQHAPKTVSEQELIARACKDPVLVATLGDPVTPAKGYTIGGHQRQKGAAFQEDLSVNVSGPKGQGKLHLHIQANNHQLYLTMALDSGGKQIPLGKPEGEALGVAE